ncbi:AAA family ATPase [Helicobacter japonicus]|uniref:ATP-binding protein n=4 Tax=Helicobacter japonicus TaxID=425400 RepID=A0A4U8TQB2_9HELI|nr:ATP-binding protein [Helicobacter japonicus]TLE02035.1 ATP-binding protein [Helicobacter japonicus]
MLIEVKMKNCFSIQEEQVLSLVASNDKQLKGNTFQADNLTLLKSVAIYGANAAGKSNIIKIMQAIRVIVLHSTLMQRGIEFPLMPFLLGKDKEKPSEFEISFIAENVKYRYGFTATQKKILEEWLFAYPNGRMQQWFLRAYDTKNDKYKYEFGSKFLGEKKLWENSTRENALFLSTAIQLNSKQLRPVFDWFLGKFNMSSISGLGDFINILKQNPQEISKYLKAVDFDIENLILKEEEANTQEASWDLFNETISIDSSGKAKKSRVKAVHLDQQGQPIEFDMVLESEGTREFFRFLVPIINIFQKGGILIIDELHNHLHPLMTKFIINLFHNENINKNNAQLIFTTHETSILDKDIFRKDQIYFCEKQNKATKLYAMSDFKGLRENIDFEKSYLLGRFGALPNLGQI